jgi:putative ABC transport system permease protein
MLVTTPMLDQFGWKVGDTVPLTSESVKTDGSKVWTFHIVGTMDTPASPTKAYFSVINYDYFNTARVADRDSAEQFYVLIADPTKAVATGSAIDRLFANSGHETRTQSAEQGAEARAKQMGDVSFFTDAILCAVIFALAFVTGNTLRQSLHERTREFAVLKTVGYPDRSVWMLAFAEALLLCVPPAAIGLAVAYLLAPLAREDIGWVIVSPAVTLAGLSCAALLAVLGASLPAHRLARVSIVRSLARQ